LLHCDSNCAIAQTWCKSPTKRGIFSMNSTTLQIKRPEMTAWLTRAGRSLVAFLKAVGETNARAAMLAEARKIEASRPDLAARLRRFARGGSWV
jgi:hypothetical protein